MGTDIPLYVLIVCSFCCLVLFFCISSVFLFTKKKKTKGGKDGIVAWHFIHHKYTYTLNCDNFDNVLALVYQQHCSNYCRVWEKRTSCLSNYLCES